MDVNQQGTTASKISEPEEKKQALLQPLPKDSTKSYPPQKRRKRIRLVLVWIAIGLVGWVLLAALGSIWGWTGVIIFFVLIGILLLVLRFRAGMRTIIKWLMKAIIKWLGTFVRPNIKRLGVFGYDKEIEEYTPDRRLVKITKEHQPGKTLWDWMQLLIIPLVLSIGGLLFSSYQHQQDQQIALDQQRATILQTYIGDIQDLLLNHHLLKADPFNPSNPYNDVETLARARTLTALQGLDPERKGRLLQFLYEAKLIGIHHNMSPPINAIIDLSDADLTGADLRGAYLRGAYLSLTNLTGADLRGAYLGEVYLFKTNLSGANLSNAFLTSAHNLTQQQLDQVSSCQGADLPDLPIELACNKTQ